MRNGPYLMSVAPIDYPGKRYRGRYAYDHHLEWWRKTGTTVPEGFHVHHRNENKHDNSHDNLELLSKAAHASEHAREAETPVDIICLNCGAPYKYNARNYRYKRKIGQKNFFCGGSCATTYQWNNY